LLFTEVNTINYGSLGDIFETLKKKIQIIPIIKYHNIIYYTFILNFFKYLLKFINHYCQGIKQALMDRRRQLEFSIYPYESHTRKLVSKLMDMKETANNYFMQLKQIEAYRWSVSVGKLFLLCQII